MKELILLTEEILFHIIFNYITWKDLIQQMYMLNKEWKEKIIKYFQTQIVYKQWKKFEESLGYHELESDSSYNSYHVTINDVISNSYIRNILLQENFSNHKIKKNSTFNILKENFSPLPDDNNDNVYDSFDNNNNNINGQKMPIMTTKEILFVLWIARHNKDVSYMETKDIMDPDGFDCLAITCVITVCLLNNNNEDHIQRDFEIEYYSDASW